MAPDPHMTEQEIAAEVAFEMAEAPEDRYDPTLAYELDLEAMLAGPDESEN